MLIIENAPPVVASGVQVAPSLAVDAPADLSQSVPDDQYIAPEPDFSHAPPSQVLSIPPERLNALEDGSDDLNARFVTGLRAAAGAARHGMHRRRLRIVAGGGASEYERAERLVKAALESDRPIYLHERPLVEAASCEDSVVVPFEIILLGRNEDGRFFRSRDFANLHLPVSRRVTRSAPQGKIHVSGASFIREDT